MTSGNILTVWLLLISIGNVYSQTQPDKLLLKDFRPHSIYKIPVTENRKKDIPVIDMHSHAYANTEAELKSWVNMLRQKGVKKTIILSGATGSKFDSIQNIYSRYGDLFEVWCGFDYTGFGTEAWPEAGLKELNRCFEIGAKGIGELGDKGLGEIYSHPVKGYGIHIDDKNLQPLLKRCGELKMPVSIHVAEPRWMYEPMDSTNDGLMNASIWQVDKSQKGFRSYNELVTSLESAVRSNPETIFIACHFANCENDLSVIGMLLDRYPNLYADIAARYAETAVIPRYMKMFYQQHSRKLLYGTDMGMDSSMYNTTFRILETSDEHFYETELFNYHWACNGFDLD
jgi:predicted TIM-barrel fold metal-dependent hydrolase